MKYVLARCKGKYILLMHLPLVILSTCIHHGRPFFADHSHQLSSQERLLNYFDRRSVGRRDHRVHISGRPERVARVHPTWPGGHVERSYCIIVQDDYKRAS